MKTAEEIIQVFDNIKSERGLWENQWEEIAQFILPRQDNITTSSSPGEKKGTRIFDSSPQIALERFGAVMDSTLTPAQQTWHGLKSMNEELNREKEVKDWFYHVNMALFKYRYNPKANFSGQNSERWVSMGAFGTGALFIDYYHSLGLRYKTIHLKNLYLLENHQGMIDSVFRRLDLTLRQAIQQWGFKNLPELLQKHAEDPKKLAQVYPFLHVVAPRNDRMIGILGVKGMPYRSIYLCLKSKSIIGEGGYWSFPYSIARYVTAPNEVYGRSPAMSAISDIKMLNEMSKTDIRAVHKLVDPPLLLSDDGVLGAGSGEVDLTPGAINFGGVDMQGKPLILPLQTGARVDISEDKMELRRRRIDDAFLITLFQILVENPRMTATEALIRAQEKGMLLAPAMGRQQSEALGPQIERELDLLTQHGLLPDPPAVLIEAGEEIDVVYDAPINRLRRAEELVGVQRSLELLAPFASIKPTILDIFDEDELARLTTEVSGAPSIILKSREQIAEMRETQQAQQTINELAATAPPIAGALKDAAQAQAMVKE